MAQINVNLTGVEPATGFSPLPKGFYKAMIDESSVEPTKGGDGAFLKLRFVIVDGPFNGRTVYSNMNIQNPNKKTVDIALAQLSAICKAVNVVTGPQGFESSSLHNQPLIIKVKIDKDDYNQIMEYMSFADLQAKHPEDAAQMGLGQAAVGGFTPPPMQTATLPAFTPPVANSAPAFAPQLGAPPAFAAQPAPSFAPPISAPPAFQAPAAAPAPMTPPTFAPAPAAAPVVVNYWISHPSINGGEVLLKSDKETIGLVASGLFDILVMSEDQSSGWKKAEDFGLVNIIQSAGAAPTPAPGMPVAPMPWNTAK